jgi:hypothetical protein
MSNENVSANNIPVPFLKASCQIKKADSLCVVVRLGNVSIWIRILGSIPLKYCTYRDPTLFSLQFQENGYI